MHTEENIQIEAQGVKRGMNPMFGTWSQEFKIEPVSYQNQRDKKEEFRKTFQSQLNTEYFFYGDLEVIIILYLNEQKVEENPQYGDLDNYAKQILDCIKGLNGLMIDDCQVQTLTISWIDVPSDSYFEVTVKGRPDDFCQKPLKLYEMSDNRFYPVSPCSWTQEGLVGSTPEQISLLLRRLDKMVSNAKKAKHDFRKSGITSLEAYRTVKFLMPSLIGFHKSTIVDSGFELLKRNEWSSII